MQGCSSHISLEGEQERLNEFYIWHDNNNCKTMLIRNSWGSTSHQRPPGGPPDSPTSRSRCSPAASSCWYSCIRSKLPQMQKLEIIVLVIVLLFWLVWGTSKANMLFISPHWLIEEDLYWVCPLALGMQPPLTLSQLRNTSVAQDVYEAFFVCAPLLLAGLIQRLPSTTTTTMFTWIFIFTRLDNDDYVAEMTLASALALELSTPVLSSRLPWCRNISRFLEKNGMKLYRKPFLV